MCRRSPRALPRAVPGTCGRSARIGGNVAQLARVVVARFEWIARFGARARSGSHVTERGGEHHAHGSTHARLTVNMHLAVVGYHDLARDSKAKPQAARLAGRPRLVNLVETFGHPLQFLHGYAAPGILHLYKRALPLTRQDD